MIKRIFLFISLILFLSVTGCVKDTYNMKMLSKKAYLSPTLAISAVKGDISFSDAVKSNDTVVFDQNKLVILVFRQDSIVDLKLSDFSKGILVKTAEIEPGTFDLDIKEFLDHISGDFLLTNPSIKFNYSNSFPDSVKVNLTASGTGKGKKIDLKLSPFGLVKPDIPAQQVVTSTFLIDRNNSNLPLLMSIPPEKISYSGTVSLSTTVKSNEYSDILSPNHMTGSLEIEIPLELKINNLQFTDTTDNFIHDKNSSSDSPVKPEDFQFLRVLFSAKNGFPLGVSLKMSLYDSATHTIKSTVDAAGILKPATVDSNGKANGTSESSTTIEFTKEFFSQVDKADKIIFSFSLVSTGNGEVKIYSDYRLNFTAAVVVKPEINVN